MKIPPIKLLFLFFCVISVSCKNTKQLPKATDLNTVQPLDMVLIYTGGATRQEGWFQRKHFKPYLILNKSDETFDWLFDAFLFLEIKDGDKSFLGSHGKVPANKNDWKNYIDKFFTSDFNIDALNKQLEIYKSQTGATSRFRKRKVIIGIPEAKEEQSNWGMANGEELNFNYEKDRIKAYKWFIDYAIKKFNNQSYDNLELVAFYWIQEGKRIENTINEVSNYLHDKNYSFYWVPHILGANNINNNWKALGFDRAYLQPGYFYRTDKDYKRLARSADMIKEYEYFPYVEFSSQALKNKENWGYRLHNTIDVFEKNDFWTCYPMGYYQGFNALYRLYNSKDEEDVALYYRLAKKVAKRQKKCN